MDYLNFNTRSNRVVIISSIIKRIFLTLCNTGTVTFQPVSIKTLVIYIYVHMCSCQLVPIYTLLSFIYFVHCSTIYSFVFISHQFFVLLFKRKRTILILNLFSGISIPLTVHHHQYESLNIIQQTPPTLS
jgi:hypothetical protein